MSGNGVEFPKGDLAEFCRGQHVVKLSLFGSVLREHFRPDSDVGVLVEFEEGHVPAFFELARMERSSRSCSGGGRWT